ncbi:MAG: cytochrome b/b6 domain-containing protein [Candidatus Omnitrophota bacterium]|nr:cytochrome b/b6 domain-containing protein [Candidatus Omnitrophota bacterium]
MSKLIWAVFFIIFFPAQSFCKEDISNEDCLKCHDDFKIQAFNNSVHSSDLCTSCHTDIQKIPHPDKPAKVDCSSCHKIESEVYNASDHGRAVKVGAPAAKCLDCHGQPHEILDARNRESPVFRLNIPQTCAKCHEDEEKMARYNLLEKKPILTYSETVHGKALLEKGLASSAVCTDCHGSHNLSSPINPKSKIYRLNVPNTCGKCHENVLNTYLRSIHGKAAMAGVRDAPVCTDCHGEHTIKSHKDPLSSVYSTAIAKKTCGQCHASERVISKYHLPGNRLETYFESYHGLASKMGVTTVANCVSCHGVHDILPSSDPDSAVNKNNLQRTCGKCHPNAGAELAKGSVHLSPSMGRDQAVYYVTWFYIILIVLTIGGMIAHNILDFIPKFKAHCRRYHEEAKDIRFTENECLQHTVLTISFIILAYTGFALRYPRAWWAMPFAMWGTGFDWRGIIHRTTAVIFSASAVYHAYYLFFTKRGKEQLKALVPKWKDFFDVIKMTKYNLGIEKKKPDHARYNYVEKAEYWALVWGSVIMLITGSILTFEDFFLQYFPKWILDVARTIHYYEAVLAVLAILVWHLYFVIFDPDRYPLDLSIITGKASKKHQGEDDGAPKS